MSPCRVIKRLCFQSPFGPYQAKPILSRQASLPDARGRYTSGVQSFSQAVRLGKLLDTLVPKCGISRYGVRVGLLPPTQILAR